MVSAITHSMIYWCYTAYLMPANEGLARITRALQGVNLHDTDQTTLTWSERAVHLLTGLTLLIPLLNLVVWVFMRTLGNAEILSKPFISMQGVEPWEAAMKAAEPECTKIEPLTHGTEERPLHTKNYTTSEQLGSKAPFEAKWTLETFSKTRTLNRISSQDSFKSTFDLGWSQLKFEFKNAFSVFCIEKIGHEKLSLTAEKTKNNISVPPELPFENPALPWIQEPTGFIPFIRSSEMDSMHFYGVDPRDFSLVECIVTKGAAIDFKNGKAIPLKIKMAKGFGSYFAFADTLHDPETGQLLESNFMLSILTWGKIKVSTDNE